MKILLAVDKSLHAEHAVRALTRCFTEAEVEVLQVLDLEVNPHPHLSGALIEGYHRKLREALRAEAGQVSPKFQAILAPVFRKVCVSVREGRTAEVILETAANSGADLIVLGSRGLSPIQSLLLGSVSYRVVHEATCPVLVIKRELPAVRKILLAMDRSDGAEEAVRFLAEQSLFSPCRVVVLTVCPSPPFAGLFPETVRHQGHASALEHVNKVGRRLSLRGFAVEPLVVEGESACEILSHGEAEDIDLVVTGARSHLGVLTRCLLGSVSRKVLVHTTKCVLIVHGGDAHVTSA